jgi:uncharacterized protein
MNDCPIRDHGHGSGGADVRHFERLQAHGMSSTPASRAWQRMLSGRRLDLLDPSPNDIEIEDIAHGLARVARWNGQTVGAHALSVAQHVLIVETIAADLNQQWPAPFKLAALLHDAPEYVIGDLISPFKTAIGLDYKAFETQLLRAIHIRFGLADALPAAITAGIKRADQVAAYYEASRLAGFAHDEAERFFGTPDRLSPALEMQLNALEAWPVSEAQEKFLLRFSALCGSASRHLQVKQA